MLRLRASFGDMASINVPQSARRAGAKPKPLKLALCASGGGHVRQVLDLEDVWRAHDFFFVTEDLALGRSIAKNHPAFFVAHYALGQARLGAPFRMLIAALRNMLQSFMIIFRERPDVVLTTGAGSMFFVLLFARLAGAKIILIDSFARFRAPSAFARIAGPLADVRVSQSGAAAGLWKATETFDPLRMLDGRRPAKEPLVFATVGATLPFDRLVRMVEDAKRDGLLPEHVILQVGDSPHVPAGIEEVHASLPFDDVKDILRRADIVVCHGGTGSLITALQNGCRVIAVPRLFELGEHYDDHQLEVTSAFAARGLLAVVDQRQDFATALAKVRAQEPVMATTEPAALRGYLTDLLVRWAKEDRQRHASGLSAAAQRG
ncbi:beta-1,4-glucuronosyltransferase WelK [Sphingomonas mucosissima]|uniref:UDP-N-acetylglucosamine transferase n=1 Tax=Sphingomonas mucosissima TaxID=370959 RepID=A0A245ZQV6_9SPHN|nr:glycosyltransferase [Sphingomonas mucosissima]OWK32101.1 UDP-N-acetylglucosamine transferase [Sphingomonas mucosissima]